MDILFKIISAWDDSERHEVIVDGVEWLSQSSDIESEDVEFYRDLSSPHDCEPLLELVIKRTKEGEEVNFLHEEVIEEDG